MSDLWQGNQLRKEVLRQCRDSSDGKQEFKRAIKLHIIMPIQPLLELVSLYYIR